ncbi:uncharacterized protein [Dermacentor albipictus]|uniref:uncharacterized protein n=1 Tax=Dermacentor albipictus TaxID=60249 RepID=UPI0031FDCB78
MRRLRQKRATKMCQSCCAHEASTAAVPEAERISQSAETCVLRPIAVVPSQTASTVAASSTSFPSPPPSPAILGVPFVCPSGLPDEASDVLDSESTVPPSRLREQVHGGLKSKPVPLSHLPNSEAAFPVEWVGESAASYAVAWTRTQGDIKSEPKSSSHRSKSKAVSPFKCIDSVDAVSLPLLSAVPSSSLPGAANTDLTLLVEPSPPNGHCTPSVTPVQKKLAARTSPHGSRDCAGDGCTDSDESMTIASTPTVSESDSESGLDSDSGINEGAPSNMADKSGWQGSLKSSWLARKRHLNKHASARYRRNKKQRLSKIEQELAKLSARNAKLQLQVKSAEAEISLMKGVLVDIGRAKAPINLYVITSSKDT